MLELKQNILDVKNYPCMVLREFGEKYTLKGISKMLNRLGFSYTKATYTLVRANKEE
ncbi:winged helix-turn-helix domain-containing protein [Paenibacillus sp. IHB B 3415]|uniref:helix-turn-helix domain-containing protein n=1 Tax=Paenibacillus sp. IHB B 3415 TaxID=867080 RepID=UPI0009FB336D